MFLEPFFFIIEFLLYFILTVKWILGIGGKGGGVWNVGEAVKKKLFSVKNAYVFHLLKLQASCLDASYVVSFAVQEMLDISANWWLLICL